MGSACPCESNRFAHDASTVPAAAMGRLGEHREKVRSRGPFPVRPRLNLHEPDTTTRDGLLSDVDDEAGEPIRLHLRLRPTTVRAVRDIEVRSRDFRDCIPHAPAMADEEIQIPQGCPTDDSANHGARIRSGDLSLRIRNVLTLFKVDFLDS